MTVEIYGVDLSAPCRNVFITLDFLNVPYEVKETIPFLGHTRTPEYLKLNPQHNIPTYKEGDFVLNESRAIMTYLAAKHGNTKLYPTDVTTRARVDQRLYFDMGSFWKSAGAVVRSVIFEQTKPTEAMIDSLKENLGWLNDFIKPSGYVAGTDHVTLADLSLLVTYSTIAATGVVDLAPYTEIPAWFEKVKKEVPNYHKANGEGAEKFGEFYKGKAKELGLA